MKMLKIFFYAVACVLASSLPVSKGDEDLVSYEEYWQNALNADDLPTKSIATSTDDILSTAFLIVTVVGLLANTVVFFVIFCGNEIAKTVTALYVLQLAIADSVFLVALLFFAMQQLNYEWAFGEAMCVICQTIKNMNYYAGIFFLTAMSIDRYIAVAYSTKAHKFRTQQRARWSCVGVWVASALISLPAMLYSKLENIHGNELCRIVYPGYKSFNSSKFRLTIEETGESFGLTHVNISFQDSISSFSLLEQFFNETSWNVTNEFYEDPTEKYQPHKCWFENEPLSFYVMESLKFVIGFIIPFAIISGSYIQIIHRLRQSEEKLPPRNGTRTHFMRKRVTRMVSALVICFGVCWLPYHIFNFLMFKGFYQPPRICYAIECFVVVLGYSNSAFNPILYTFLGHDFKQRLNKSLTRTRRRFSIGNKSFASGIFFPFQSRKSSQRSRSSSMRPTKVNYFQVQQNSSNTSTAGCCPGDCTILLTRQQNSNNVKNIPLLEVKTNNNPFWKCEPAEKKQTGKTFN